MADVEKDLTAMEWSQEVASKKQETPQRRRRGKYCAIKEVSRGANEEKEKRTTG